MSESEFNPKAAIAELYANEGPRAGPRLTFAEKCAAFYALHSIKGKRNEVRQAFGITATTASMLANCLHQPDREHPRATALKWRYREVAREYERLGDEEFARRYYTEDFHQRLVRLRLEQGEPGDDRTLDGPNPRADKFAFAKYGAVSATDFSRTTWWARVDWTSGNNQAPDGPGGPGWRFIFCQPNGDLADSPICYRGMEALADIPPAPFKRSTQAHAAIFKVLNP